MIASNAEIDEIQYLLHANADLLHALDRCRPELRDLTLEQVLEKVRAELRSDADWEDED